MNDVYDTTNAQEKSRRWQMILGGDEPEFAHTLSDRDKRLSQALTALYGDGDDGKKSGLGRSAPKVAKWLGDIREFFPSSVVQVVQKDAFERLGLKQMLLEPEFLSAMQADVHLVADLVSLRSAMPDKTLDTARVVVKKVVDEMLAKLQNKTTEAVKGAVNKAKRTHRPRHADIDWGRTIQANLRHYQADYQTVIPETLIGFMRQNRQTELDEVILCVDQSGSMATSVVYSAIFAAVLASIPALKTRLVCFDTVVLDLTDELADPVQVLFGVQLGGGTDINQAVAYCANKVEHPAKTHLVLITDLYEGGNEKELIARVANLKRQGVNVIVLLALSDDGRPAYDEQLAKVMASLDCPVFACTPDEFPDMMATALKREDVLAWASDKGIKAVRGDQAKSGQIPQ
ncbi:VWA domain-containing protein [Moraxella sp. VT-16-12]|uniref:VWA domain-containing protein n=1 Tax=Moraxella sp. VT-16-12 TaxID=2014877 RepID=UPI000B7C952E|nr:VWA domain-containing protein [Moraxella sp. VT-16-12]TWV83924.1 VWA domain-containing protein [Moraxella sp. VT-16-12]